MKKRTRKQQLPTSSWVGPIPKPRNNPPKDQFQLGGWRCLSCGRRQVAKPLGQRCPVCGFQLGSG